jgi:hypothetical protein
MSFVMGLINILAYIWVPNGTSIATNLINFDYVWHAKHIPINYTGRCVISLSKFKRGKKKEP